MANEKLLKIDVSQMDKFVVSLDAAPKVLAKNLSKGFFDIGKYDIETLKQRLPGKFNIRSKGVLNAFKFKAKMAKDVANINQLSVNEYTGWKAAQIFQTGGIATGHGKSMTVLTPAALRLTGKRKFTQKEVRELIASKKAKFIFTPRGRLLVLNERKLTKSGKEARGSKFTILAMLKKSIKQVKRLDFFENIERNQSVHVQLLEARVEQAFEQIVADNRTSEK